MDGARGEDGAGRAGGDLRVSVRRSGGFAGRTLTASLDSAALPAEQAEQLRAAADGLDFASLADPDPDPPPAGAGGRRGGADRFQWDVDVERAGQHHRLVVHDGAVPEGLRPLLDHVLRAGRPPRG